MKKLFLFLAIIGLQAFLPAQEQSYLGEYQIQEYCTLENEDWHEENNSYVINVEPCDEYGLDFQFRYNEHGIFNSYIKGRIGLNGQFILPSQQFVHVYEYDTVGTTYFSGNGRFEHDSLFMNYHMASTTAYGALVCDCKGVRLDAAVETPLENPAVFWRLSPQPATENVQAVCEATETGGHNGSWRLVDAGGKALRRGTFSDARFEVSLSGIPAGLYFIEITANGTTCRLKCVKR